MVLRMVDITRVQPKEIIDDVLIKVGTFIVPAEFIVLEYGANNIIQIKLGHLFLEMVRTLIDVREGTPIMRLNDEEVVFKVHKTLNTCSHYRDLYMIKTMEIDECGVVECMPLMTSLDFHIERPKPLIKYEVNKLKEEPEKASMEKTADL